mmetsp:Transcript_37016/g.71413  ORF Transcript_37016/g.71413 Transcript_37016/m.71413 type:complete len:89 (+) Transcript_37016:183-449(+)|eukprot:CAMPEP_0167792822 /NCGR_PEP_ID=MMETSP0111_2-20121227/12782_1 /TAXON_ID=91324 /ORGANISM="Lotharella globosa, Strain CCCM811" /LENGTH=88 /DNA_ID=CAMNT_0007685799 /DNA_START=163 /DNA_END=429 /DNA_ORIENTATION=-
MTNWIFNFIVAGSFLTLVETPLETQGTFWLLSGIAVAGFVWLWAYMPETRGKTLGEINQMFEELAGVRSSFYRQSLGSDAGLFTVNSG